MNIRYKIKGSAVKFDGTNFSELLGLPNMMENLTERFGELDTLQIYTQDAKERGSEERPVPIVRCYGNMWLALPVNSYIVCIENIDIIMNEDSFNNLFEKDED